MKFTFDEIVKITDAQILFATNRSGIFKLSTDSRTIKTDEIYLPLIGENFDGHSFIENAINNGARGYFTSNQDIFFKNAKFALFVDNTLIAYLKLAKYYKDKIKPLTIAITGSCGKTTTKEMAYCVFKDNFKTHKSEKNYNNEVGLAQTMLSMPVNTQVLIVEMGMRGMGEIDLLSKFAEPDVSIITNVGSAHIERLKTLDNIARAKCEIAQNTNKEGLLVAHKNKIIEKFNNFSGKTTYFSIADVAVMQHNQAFSEFIYNKNQYRINISGEHNIENAIAVIITAIKFGISPDKINLGLKKYVSIEKRWELLKIKGLKIINDSYNANPESMKASIKTFLSCYDQPLVLVLGDMMELGVSSKKFHEQIGEFLKNYIYDKLICIGRYSKYIGKNSEHDFVHFLDNKKCSDYILNEIEKGSTIMFKASRSMKFEEIIEELKK